MTKLEDFTGRTFGCWTVVARAQNVNKLTKWTCRCICGTVREVYGGNLRKGRGRGGSTGCGCQFDRESHRLSGTPEYQIWGKMVGRCTNKNQPDYPRYGGRGITIDPGWRGSFQKFYEDMGPRPPGLQLERDDNDGPYSKGNCRWATLSEQGRNKRNNRIIEFAGEKHCLVEWAEKTGISRGCILQRIDNMGWTIEAALTTPARVMNHR